MVAGTTKPPGAAPNVVIVVFDDTGFAHFGCYGSTIETPTIDRLAAGGLRYAGFHTTALCSPSRACLLTGRNHHAVGMRGVSNFDTGFPNMRGAINPRAATVAELLREHGYATYSTGKWHLAPMHECSAAGPHDNWPLQKGFDRFYGFLQGETDQFYPIGSQDTNRRRSAPLIYCWLLPASSHLQPMINLGLPDFREGLRDTNPLECCRLHWGRGSVVRLQRRGVTCLSSSVRLAF